jgi:hypothetical protein
VITPGGRRRRYRAENWTWRVRVPAHRWRIIGATVVGIIGSFIPLPLIGIIDNTNGVQNGKYSPAQNVVEGIGVATWFVATAVVVLLGVHRWRSKVALGTSELAKLPARRSIYLARGVVTDVAVSGTPGSRRVICTLTLQNGVQVIVPRSRGRRPRNSGHEVATESIERRHPRTADDVAAALRVHLLMPPSTSVTTVARPDPLASHESVPVVAPTSLTFGGISPAPLPSVPSAGAAAGVTVSTDAPTDAIVTVDEITVGARGQLVRALVIGVTWGTFVAAIVIRNAITSGNAVIAVIVALGAAVLLSLAAPAFVRRTREIRVGARALSVRTRRGRWRTLTAENVVCVRGQTITNNRSGRVTPILYFYDAAGRKVLVSGLWLTPAVAQQLETAFGTQTAWTNAAATIAAMKAPTNAGANSVTEGPTEFIGHSTTQ